VELNLGFRRFRTNDGTYQRCPTALMNSKVLTPMVLDLARRLLAYEAANGNSYEKTSGLRQVSEKFRLPLSALVGAIGFHALLSQALTLAKAHSAALSVARVKADGTLEGLSEVHDDKTVEASAILIAQLLGLLVTFIGEKLTMRLVQEIWPDLSAWKKDSVEQN
jgi:hypothetical protein